LNITIKLHKEGAPIRSIVSYKYAPSYCITKITANWLKRHLELQFEYNVENSLKCAEKITEIQSTYKMLTLDITNLYTNIPINETMGLIKKKLNENTCFDDSMQYEIIELIKSTMSQKLFSIQ
jgi:hypothetical protein